MGTIRRVIHASLIMTIFVLLIKLYLNARQDSKKWYHMYKRAQELLDRERCALKTLQQQRFNAQFPQNVQQVAPAQQQFVHPFASLPFQVNCN